MYEGTNVYTLMRRYFTLSLSLSLSLSHTCKFYSQNIEKRGKRGIAKGPGTREREEQHMYQVLSLLLSCGTNLILLWI